MKYEFIYGQEAKCIEAEQQDDTPVLINGDETFHLFRRKSRTWNIAVFIGLGSIGSSSVCSDFTIASRNLYSDELASLAKKISRFSADINWPNWETVDRHYFVQILDGVIRSALPEVTGTRLLNPKEFFAGMASPFLALDLTRLHKVGRHRGGIRRTWLAFRYGV